MGAIGVAGVVGVIGQEVGDIGIPNDEDLRRSMPLHKPQNEGLAFKDVVLRGESNVGNCGKLKGVSGVESRREKDDTRAGTEQSSC